MDANFTPASTAAPYAGRCPENSLTCARILSPAEVLVIAIDVPVLLFHASVFYFILRQITGNKSDFRSAFYRLYAAMSVVDMIHTIDVYICLRLPVYGIFLDFWESSVVVASAGYLISGYCVYYQFFSHLTVALNRFSVFAFPQSYKKVWTKKNVHWAILVNSLLPFPFLSFRFPAEVRYLYVGANSMGVRYMDPEIRKVSFRAGILALQCSARCVNVSKFEPVNINCLRFLRSTCNSRLPALCEGHHEYKRAATRRPPVR
ncbi:Protein SRV-2 [Aphelenchoides avenae]|nr:Protein SRV-2 [Aphelenchus avenae]